MPIFSNATGMTFPGDPTFFDVGGDAHFHSNSAALNGLYEQLRPVEDAGYTRGGQVARCDPGTRVTLIDTIKKWVDTKSRDAPSVCWLNGPAGYGKSALSQTIAELCAENSRLAASFFFLRGAGARSRIDRLIPTLAYHISVSIPTSKTVIEKVLDEEPFILSTSLTHQFQKLVIEPLLAASSGLTAFLSTTKANIIVIDALDECDDKFQMGEFITAIIAMAGKRFPLIRILLTSRVEEHIRRKFDHPRASTSIYRLELVDFDARPDIQAYFQKRFNNVYQQNFPIMRGLPQPWPSPSDLNLLLSKAGGSFMFATTLISWIEASEFPDRDLKLVLQSDVVGLDPLYKQVLSEVSLTPSFHHILGTTMILVENQSITAISKLLGFQSREIIHELLAVQSLLLIPGDDDQPILLFHTSLRDFLTSQARSESYYINPSIQHALLAIDCLQCLTNDVEQNFFDMAGQRYACCHWLHHICQAFGEQRQDLSETNFSSLVNLVNLLMSKNIESWFNTILNCNRDTRKSVVQDLEAVLSCFQEEKFAGAGKKACIWPVLEITKKEMQNWNNWIGPITPSWHNGIPWASHCYT